MAHKLVPAAKEERSSSKLIPADESIAASAIASELLKIEDPIAPNS